MTQMGAAVHLIAGSTGAGKTTYARELAAASGGIRFSIDEWMTALFWPDAPEPIDAAWAMERVERCYARISQVAFAAARRGVPVILDLGLTTRASRARFAAEARAGGLEPRLHVLKVPVAERWRRVEARNLQTGPDAQLGFAVTRAMFDYVEGLWEPPGEAEMADLQGLLVGGEG